MNVKLKNVLIAGGGTGGHLFPAFAIGEKLEQQGFKIQYIGSKHGIEKKYKHDIDKKIYLLDIKGLNRNLSIKSVINNIIFPIKFIIAYIQSIIIIQKTNPEIVIGTGGYSSGIPMLAAIHLNKKTVIHEQNSYPGITTRFLSKKVDCVYISYENIKRYIKTKNYLLTGNPIREHLENINREIACKNLGLNPKKKIIFILGGSQGSAPFNTFFLQNYKNIIDNNIQIIWQTGPRQFNKINSLITNPKIIIRAFFKKINYAYSCSDVVISRAGALAIEELKFFQKAMILIPFPGSANNHQKLNAIELANKNAAYLIEQKNIDNELTDTILKLVNDKNTIQKISKNAKKMYNSNSLNLITNSILDYINV